MGHCNPGDNDKGDAAGDNKYGDGVLEDAERRACILSVNNLKKAMAGDGVGKRHVRPDEMLCQLVKPDNERHNNDGKTQVFGNRHR